jgi:hypothetical protein
MSVHPHEPVPITDSPVRRRRKSDLAIPIGLLATVVMLGLGITVFSSSPVLEPTVSYAIRGR